MTRPAFLQQNHTNGQTIVEDFRKLALAEAAEVDRWFTAVGTIHGTTWQEACLARWLDDQEDLGAALLA